MTREALATELLSMRKQAERTVQSIDELWRNLYAERESLWQVVKEYGAKRVELLKEEFQAREMLWCTYCSAVIPEGEAELMLIEGREEYTCAYDGGNCYGFRDFSKLYRACPACRERAADRHGQKGAYDALAKDQSSYYAFRVEKREDGHYARKFGNWVKLDDKSCELDEPSSHLVEKFAEEWNLPPRIEIDRRSSIEQLIVHERTLTEAR